MLRLVVSLLGDKSEEVVSFIFSQEDPAMTVRQGFTLKSVEDKDRNNALLLKCNLISSAPLSIFKNREGKIKVIEGVLQNVEALRESLKSHKR